MRGRGGGGPDAWLREAPSRARCAVSGAGSPHQRPEGLLGGFSTKLPRRTASNFSSRRKGLSENRVFFFSRGTTFRSKRQHEIHSLNIKTLNFLGEVDGSCHF